jgi:hypothetical protein
LILFVAGRSARDGRVASGAAAQVLRGLVEDLPFLGGRPVQEWSAPSGAAAAAWVGHGPEAIGPIEHVHAHGGRLALFAGRPIRWGEDDRALDPRRLLEAEPWAGLDGRFAALRDDDAAGRMEVLTDPVGAYPLFRCEAQGARWVSNSPEALRRLAGPGEVDRLALAGLLSGGWSPHGDPLFTSVRRVPRGTLLTLGGDAPAEPPQALPDAEIAALAGAGWDPAEAARLLTESVRALAAWPGRPSLVPVTGGRDSRRILAAALRAGIDFEAVTGGAPDDPDVVAGRALCERAGIGHAIVPADPHGDVFSDPTGSARLLGLITGGTASLADAAGFPMGPREGPLPLWHSGQGGEIARAYYGPGRAGDAEGLASQLYASFTGRRPGRAEPLSEVGRALIHSELLDWVTEQLDAGADPADVPDLFYVHRRMGTWAAPTHGAVEFVRDTTSPLWSARLLPHLLGARRDDRTRERFHRRVLEELAPELVDVPFAGGEGWGRPSRLRRIAGKAAAEARRRLGPRRASAASGTDDPVARVQRLVAAAAAERRDHPAWSVLDRGRVDALLARPTATLDPMSRLYVWRLATVFLAT